MLLPSRRLSLVIMLNRSRYLSIRSASLFAHTFFSSQLLLSCVHSRLVKAGIANGVAVRLQRASRLCVPHKLTHAPYRPSSRSLHGSLLTLGESLRWGNNNSELLLTSRARTCCAPDIKTIRMASMTESITTETPKLWHEQAGDFVQSDGQLTTSQSDQVRRRFSEVRPLRRR